MILTDSEIKKVHDADLYLDFYEVARAIESVVLEKLKAQEPFGHYWNYKDMEDGIVVGQYFAEGEAEEQGYTPLYTHPLPPDDVVRDAARYKWLRDSHNHWSWKPSQYNKDIVSGFTHCDTGYLGYALQEAIDAAMKEVK